MNNRDPFDFIIVIRSAKERTKEACRYLAGKELPDELIHVIEQTPFEAAVRKCYRLGMESGKKWMITIDADILPVPGFLSKIEKFAEEADENVIMFNAIIHDKLLLKYRSGGIKTYRAKYLGEALEYVPENGTTLRPEAATLLKMTERGLKKKNFPDVIGLHDYKQYYHDIYRKCFFHAAKHTDEIGGLLTRWKELSEKDADYKTAIRGAIDGLLSEKDAKPDVRLFDERSRKAVSDLGINEKPDIVPDHMDEFINQTLKNLGPFRKKFEWNSIKSELDKQGVLDGSRWLIGSALEVAGKKMKP